VDNSVKRLILGFRGDEKVFKKCPITKLSFDEINAWREEIAAAMTEVVKDDSRVSRFGKEPGDCTTYIPGTASNQDLHKKALLLGTLWFNVSLLH
jgi:hypothetical protein